MPDRPPDPNDAAAHGGGEPVPRLDLEAVVADLERANAELAQAVSEAEAFTTEMEARTAQLDGLHDLFDAALARSTGALVVVDARGVVRGWSGGASARFGLPADKAVGRRMASLRRPGLPSGRIAASVRDLVAGRPVRDGAGFSCYPVAGRSGPPDAVVVVVDGDESSGVEDDALAEPGDDVRQPA